MYRLDSPAFMVRVVVNLCGALFLAVLGVQQLVKATPSLIQLIQLQRNGVQTQAISHGQHDDGYHYTMGFTYIANGGSFSKSEDVSQEFYEKHRYGGLTVYYDRTQPSNAYVDLAHIYGLRRAEMLFGIGTIALCVALFSICYWVYFGRNQESV